MTKEELTLLNIGDDLDTLMNLDPRGYGVCRILYDGARRFTEEPLSVHGAKGLIKNIKKGEKVFILTGFVLLPWDEAETDGIISSTVLARFLMKAFGAKPVMIVPSQCKKAIRAMSNVLSFKTTDDLDNTKPPAETKTDTITTPSGSTPPPSSRNTTRFSGSVKAWGYITSR